jgi:hypothetical protein
MSAQVYLSMNLPFLTTPSSSAFIAEPMMGDLRA